MNRLVILSGPSCVGKSPLHAALIKFYPELAAQLRKIVLYNCRAPRPGERDGVNYHFRSRSEIEALRSDKNFAVFEVRGDLQALDLRTLDRMLAEGDVFFEGNPFVGTELQQRLVERNVRRLSVFLSPLSKAEILYLRNPILGVSLPDFLTDVMRRKLLRRTTKQKGILSAKDLENIERRAASAYLELQLAYHFDFVIPNHDGEDSENWSDFYYPIGDARRTLFAFVALLEGREQEGIEKWDEGLLPDMGAEGEHDLGLRSSRPVFPYGSA